MKVLLDESLDVRLRLELPGHDVFTVEYMGWKGQKNGALIALAVADGFEVIVTGDRAMPSQQNISKLSIAIVVLLAESNVVEDLRPLAPSLLQLLNHVKPGTVTEVHS